MVAEVGPVTVVLADLDVIALEPDGRIDAGAPAQVDGHGPVGPSVDVRPAAHTRPMLGPVVSRMIVSDATGDQ